eukprot:TRINITY_DN10931_c0_g1_i1.p1 TRINITY_DN10931_c0_g1~~TRINITY_DN10931_c0_g1_i1.p1  ORF type:complete len:174 (-),score=26.48 TRINITY_DN10931_c0_g1_i1:103-624(-)
MIVPLFRSFTSSFRRNLSTAPRIDRPIWRKISIEGAGNGTQGRFVDIDSPRKHVFYTDDHRRDEHPSPLHLMLGSLAGCKQATIMMLAKHSKIHIDSIKYQVSGEYDARGLMGFPGLSPKFQRVQFHADITSSASHDAVQELFHKATQRCPVAALFHAAGVDMSVTFTLTNPS